MTTNISDINSAHTSSKIEAPLQVVITGAGIGERFKYWTLKMDHELIFS
jgi:hypothetical protein